VDSYFFFTVREGTNEGQVLLIEYLILFVNTSTQSTVTPGQITLIKTILNTQKTFLKTKQNDNKNSNNKQQFF
jgi:hypothetical protein